MPIPGFFKINFTDPSETILNGEVGGFIVEPYAENGTRHPSSTLKSLGNNFGENTSIVFYGKGGENYGDRLGDDLLQLLENFASPLPPVNPITGQLWFETGKSFKIIAFPATNVMILQGNVVDEINDMISLSSPPSQKAFRIINTNVAGLGTEDPANPSAINDIFPSYATFNGTDTEVGVSPSAPFIMNIGSHYAFTASNKTVLKIYNKLQNKWVSVNAAHVGKQPPYDPQAGDSWVDTNSSPGLQKIYDGVDWTGAAFTDVGGTLTGALILHDNPDGSSPNLQAATKQYVDNGLLAITGFDQENNPTSPPTTLGTIHNIVVSLQSQVNTNTADIATISGQINDTGGLIEDVETNTTAISIKYNNTGGILSGNAVFNIEPILPNNGVLFDGTLLGNSRTFKIQGQTLNGSSASPPLASPPSTTYLDTIITSNTADLHAGVRYVHNEGVTTHNLAELRSTGAIFQKGAYELDPTLVDMDATLDPNSKYVTVGELDTELGTKGSFFNSVNGWNSSGLNLTFNTAVFNTGASAGTETINLNHTHFGLTTMKIVSYEPLFEDLHLNRHYSSGDILLDKAFHYIDELKAPNIAPTLINNASNFKRITSGDFSVDTGTDRITIGALQSNYNVCVGDTIELYSESTAGFNIVDFPLHPSFTGSTPLEWSIFVLSSPAQSLYANIEIDNTEALSIAVNPNNITTVDELITALDLQINGIDSPVIPVVTISVDGTGIRFESTFLNGASSVIIEDNTLFRNMFGASASSPVINSVIGGGITGDPTILQTTATITDILYEGVLQLDTALVALDIDYMLIPNVAQVDAGLITLKQVNTIVRGKDLVKNIIIDNTITQGDLSGGNQVQNNIESYYDMLDFLTTLGDNHYYYITLMNDTYWNYVSKSTAHNCTFNFDLNTFALALECEATTGSNIPLMDATDCKWHFNNGDVRVYVTGTDVSNHSVIEVAGEHSLASYDTNYYADQGTGGAGTENFQVILFNRADSSVLSHNRLRDCSFNKGTGTIADGADFWLSSNEHTEGPTSLGGLFLTTTYASVTMNDIISTSPPVYHWNIRANGKTN